jgi:high affinity sulfate transporter 1
VKVLLRWMPGLRSLAAYQRAWLPADLVAGLVLAAALVPVGMAYAELAGLPPVYGLYASLIPLLVYAVFGPSPVLVMGPDSATASLVAAAIVPLALADPAHRIALAGMLALLVGAMALVVGVARLGFVAALLSKPVRLGYMDGIAVVVVVSQLPKLLGFKAPAEGVVLQVVEFAKGADAINPVAAALGICSLAVIVALRAWAPKVPGPLVVVFAGAVATAAFQLQQYGIATVGVLPQGLPLPSWPAVGIPQTLTLVAAAFGIAVISLTDTSVLSQSFASRFGYEVDADEEFVSLGVANLAVGLFQGFPVSGSQTRTAINQAAGAKTPLSGIVAAVVLGSMLVATPWLLQTLPISVLAAVVISAGFELADVHGTSRLWVIRRTEFALAVASFLGVILLGVLPGVFVAVALSVLNFMRRQWWPHDAVLGRVPGVKGYHDISEFADAEQVPGLLLFRFDAPLFFANAGIFRRRVLDRIKSAPTPVKRLVLCAEPIIDVDTTAADILCELVSELQARGIEFVLAEIKHPVREHIARYGLIDLIGAENIYPTIGSAVHAYIHASGVDWIDWQDAEEPVRAEIDDDSGLSADEPSRS